MPTKHAAAWNIAVSSENTPTALVLSRQNLPVLPKSAELAMEGVKKGAYIVSPATKEQADAILIATGSEVSLAVSAQAKLLAEGIDVAVVSMPSWDLFEKQDDAYKQSVSAERCEKTSWHRNGCITGWHKYVGDEGAVIAIDTFGASAPGDTVIKEFGFTEENVIATSEND